MFVILSSVFLSFDALSEGKKGQITGLAFICKEKKAIMDIVNASMISIEAVTEVLTRVADGQVCGMANPQLRFEMVEMLLAYEDVEGTKLWVWEVVDISDSPETYYAIMKGKEATKTNGSSPSNVKEYAI